MGFSDRTNPDVPVLAVKLIFFDGEVYSTVQIYHPTCSYVVSEILQRRVESLE
jgi:hypothetical protein